MGDTSANSEVVKSAASPEGNLTGKKVRRAIFRLIDRQFQIKVTLFFLLLILLSHLFLLAIHYNNFRNTAEGVMGKDPENAQTYIDKQRSSWTVDLLLGIAVITIAVGVCAFYLTQRVSGPLFAIARILDDVAAGDYKARAYLRQGDEFQWFADKINETLDAIERNHKR